MAHDFFLLPITRELRRRRKVNADAKWLVEFEPKPAARARLVCFPYAGGGACVYAHWSRLIDPRIEVRAVQLPGRESRILEQPCTDLSLIVDAILNEIERCFDKPYCFYGHSLGAKIAFEVCHEALARGWQLPERLYLAASSAPQLPRRFPPLSKLPTSEFLARLRQYGATLSAIEDDGIRAMILPMLRADFNLVENYHCDGNRNPLTVPTTLIGATEDPLVSIESLEKWNEVTKVTHTKLVKGDHFFIKTQSAAILKHIANTLFGMKPRSTN